MPHRAGLSGARHRPVGEHVRVVSPVDGLDLLAEVVRRISSTLRESARMLDATFNAAGRISDRRAVGISQVPLAALW